MHYRNLLSHVSTLNLVLSAINYTPMIYLFAIGELLLLLSGTQCILLLSTIGIALAILTACFSQSKACQQLYNTYKEPGWRLIAGLSVAVLNYFRGLRLAKFMVEKVETYQALSSWVTSGMYVGITGIMLTVLSLRNICYPSPRQTKPTTTTAAKEPDAVTPAQKPSGRRYHFWQAPIQQACSEEASCPSELVGAPAA